MNYKLINTVHQDYTPTQQILTNRGIALEDIEHYLNVTKEDNLSPLLFNNIRDAAIMLLDHIERCGNVIQVYVDCDFDGYSSSALLLNYLYARFPSITSKIIYTLHETKFHGIEMDKIQERVSLVICPDSSSNQYEEHKELAERGIDVLVLDHHQASEVSKYACIVNNQLCDYPTKSLSGVGVTYKFCQYLDSIFGDNLADDYLDLVAVGLCGDMIDMRDFETHYLTARGLSQFRNPLCEGLYNKSSYRIGTEISPFKVSFYIVPLVNAITRVGTMEEKKVVFEAMLEYKAYDLIDSTKRGHAAGAKETILTQALRVCTNVKNRQTKIQTECVEGLIEQIENENLLDHKILIVRISNPTFDKGITGLLANQLAAKYQRPVCLLTKTEHEGKSAWMGSARGYERSVVKDFRGLIQESGFAFLAEGHNNALGVGVYDHEIDNFIAWLDETLKDVDFSPFDEVDYIYNSQSLNPKDILEIAGLKSLYGQNIKEPLIAIENISVTKDMIQLMSKDKNPTLKITLSSGISLIKFKSSEEEYESLYSENGCVTITVLGKCEKNVYFEKVTPQIIIEQMEIISKQDYYF